MLATQRYNTQLSRITQIILNHSSSISSLNSALDDFAELCAGITAITPDATFDAWAEDSFLESGVAINPQAAAFCIKDYQRSVVFIRGIYAAINEAKKRFPSTKIKIVYAGCGPFATLLVPLLIKFKQGELDVHLLDIHQQSLDSVATLLGVLGLNDHNIKLVQGDACRYQHEEKVHVIIAEVMQKALEQEPQVAVTANLAPQLCERGIFIPEKIDIELCLAHWEDEKARFEGIGGVDCGALEALGLRHPLGTLFTLLPSSVGALMDEATINENTSILELRLVGVQLPNIVGIEQYDVLMLTQVQVFEQHVLNDYDAAITLPHKCYELSPLKAGLSFSVCYQFGKYPRFNFTAD